MVGFCGWFRDSSDGRLTDGVQDSRNDVWTSIVIYTITVILLRMTAPPIQLKHTCRGSYSPIWLFLVRILDTQIERC